jgi:hypothetical protein
LCRVCGDSVVAPANFKDHKFVTTLDAELIDMGMHIGAKVWNMKRLSTDFLDPSNRAKTHRTNIEVGTSGIVKAYVNGKDGTIEKVVVYFETTVGDNKIAKADVSIKPENLSAKEPDGKDKSRGGVASSSATGSTGKVGAGYGYVVDGTVIREWPNWLARHDSEQQVGMIRSSLGFVLANVVESLPEYTVKDLTIVKNSDGTHDVFTHRNFTAGEIAFAPETLDWKTRLWTNSRSVLTQHPATLHPERKFLVMDGKLRSVPSPVRPFSLFFLIRATCTKSEANLVVEYPTVTATVSITMPNAKRAKTDVSWGQDDWPLVPVMTNKEDVKAGTKLTYLDDKSLSKYAEKLAKATEGKKNDT